MTKPAVDFENRRMLHHLIEMRMENGGDFRTPERLLDSGTPEEIEAYIGRTRKLRDAYYCLMLVAIIGAIAASVIRH
jgi:hypothetical protein